MARGGLPAEALPGPLGPVRDRARVGGQVVAEDELTHPGPFGHPSHLADVGVQCGHPRQLGLVRAVPPQVIQVGDLVYQDVGLLGQGDQVVVHRGVAGEHHRAVRGVEPVRQRRNRPAVHDRHRPDPDRLILEDDHRDRPRRDLQVEALHQRPHVGHAGVQRHDVQVVGEGGQDVIDQVRRSGGGQLRVDRGHPVEHGVTLRQLRRPRRPVHPQRRQRAAYTPRVQDHAREVADVVGVQMGQEHRFQAGEVEPRLDKRGWRPASAVDHEHPPVDDHRRRDPPAPGHRHRRARCTQQDQLSPHIASRNHESRQCFSRSPSNATVTMLSASSPGRPPRGRYHSTTELIIP